MSFLDVLKNGEIPPKTTKKRGSTSYDEYMRHKRLSAPIGRKNITINKPKSFAEIQKLIDRLKKQQGVLVDFSETEVPTAQRMLDFLSGAVYALDGNIDRVDQKIYVLAPGGVDIVSKLED